MVRILFVIPTLDRSGSEKQLTLLASRLPRDQFAPEVCALTRGGPYLRELRQAGVKVTVLSKRFKLDPIAACRLSRLIRQIRPDIVHTWLFSANSYGRLLAWLHHVPVIVTSERCVDDWKGRIERAVDRWLASCTDRVVANSRAVARFYESAGIDRSKLVVIPNGIVLDSLPPVDRAAVRRELGIPPQGYVLGFVGRLWPQKRVQDLIWTTELIHNIKDVYALVIGDGPQRSALVEYTAKIGLAARVRFVGAREDVPRLWAAMDVFVLPSQFEGMPNAVLEAMWAGLPVVASNIPGSDELVADGRTGFLVPVGDRKALARQSNQLLDDPDLRSCFGAAAQHCVREQFGVEKMVDAHVQLYQKLLRSVPN